MAQVAAVEQTALEHLHELLRRLLWSVGFLFCGGAVAYIFRLEIINFLQRPLHQRLYYTSPMGSFQFVMQVCLLCGVLCALPVILYNILRFIEPAFVRRFTRRTVLSVLSASLALTFAGAAFAYYVTLPVALRFFSTVGTSELHPLISVNEYFSFILGYLATFAIVFQLPLILLFIDHIRPFGPGTLSKKRALVYIGAFAVSLVMPSSPDPLSQVSLAIPIIVLYELSILLIVLARRKRQRSHRKTQHQESDAATRFQQAAPPVFNFDAVVPVMAAAEADPAKAYPPQPHQRPLPPIRRAASIAVRPRAAPQRTNYQASFQVPQRVQKQSFQPSSRIIADIL